MTPLIAKPRELARQAVREHVVDVALGLFMKEGFDSVTVDEVCVSAEISRSTFFRYFRTKAELLSGNSDRFGRRIADSLVEQPQEMPLWEALRRSLDGLIAEYSTFPGARELVHIIVQTPALDVVEARKLKVWLGSIGPVVSQRISLSDVDDPRPAAIVGTLLAVVNSALHSWATTSADSALEKYIDLAFSPLINTDL